MCGIAGWVGIEQREADAQANITRMCDAIRHRGPDDVGTWVEGHLALGMRRLSIIDLAGGHQPIRNEDGQVTIVFNGEIYNYPALTSSLKAQGHRFSTNSDTEAIVHLYEERGVGVVDELNGMFGFAIWDAKEERLLLARDRIGIKPLYYWLTPSGLAFASELKSITSLPSFQPVLNREAVAAYLSFGYVPDPMSVFEGVHKLAPGHRLTWSRDQGAHVEEYWSPLGSEDPAIDRHTAVEHIRTLIDDAVQMRMIADVPLGAFLSGGLDSSTVVAHMARHSTQPVKTFSIGFEEREFNEADDARVVAEALGTEHTQLTVRPEVDALIEQVVQAFDEPFADSSAIPTFLVSELARQHVTVSLSGDGGDELFGGYTRYQSTLAGGRAAPAFLGSLLAGIGRRLPQGAFGRNRLMDFGRSFEGRYAGTVTLPLAPTEGGVGAASVVEGQPLMNGRLDRWFARVPLGSPAHRLMSVDLLTYLPGDILTKVDRMSMAVSLEARVPLLDHRLIEFATQIPAALKIRGEGKWIMREAVRSMLPARVFQKAKQGFAVPLKPWFRKELHHRLVQLSEESSPLAPWVDRPALLRIRAEHEVGRRDHSHLLWRLLVLHLWLREQRLS